MKKNLILIFGLTLVSIIAGCGNDLTTPDMKQIESLANSWLEQATTVANQALDTAKTQATQVADQAKTEAQKQYKKLKDDAKNGIKDHVNQKIDETFEKF